jgi:hypothetical protein
MTPDQEKQLFEDIGSIKNDLKHGRKHFEKLELFEEALVKHLERHKTLRWVLGVLFMIAGLLKIETIIGWFKG